MSISQKYLPWPYQKKVGFQIFGVGLWVDGNELLA